jgi:di/tricarboxylate transporter
MGPGISVKEDLVSSVNQSGGRSPGKTIIAVVLAIIAVLLVIQGIMFFAEPAKNLLVGSISSPPARANAHRPLWGAAALVVAVICLIGAWFTAKGGKSSAASSSGQAAAASK